MTRLQERRSKLGLTQKVEMVADPHTIPSTSDQGQGKPGNAILIVKHREGNSKEGKEQFDSPVQAVHVARFDVAQPSAP